MVRKLRDTTVSGGVSFGASSSVSANGLMSFGSETVASTLHHETYAYSAYNLSKGLRLKKISHTYTFVVNLRMLDLQPARTHNLALQH